MQRYSAVIDAKSDTVQNVPKSQMLDISFCLSVEAEDIIWFCKSCVQPAKVALLEDKSIEDKESKGTCSEVEPENKDS